MYKLLINFNFISKCWNKLKINSQNGILRISYKTKTGKDDLNWAWQRELFSSATRAQSRVYCRVTHESVSTK
jgi:hypothetical protein